MNTLTMRSARNTKRCITLPQTVPATWKWKKKIPLRGKRRGVLSTDFLSMLLFSLWKCKSPLWRKAKTDFFINWDTREGVFLCVYIYFGCRISVLDNKKDAFASSCTTYSGPAEAVGPKVLIWTYPAISLPAIILLHEQMFVKRFLWIVENIFRVQSVRCIDVLPHLAEWASRCKFCKTQKGNKKDAFASSCTTYCSPAEAVDSDHSYVNYSWRCQELGEHGSVAIRQHKCTQTYPDTANAPAFP